MSHIMQFLTLGGPKNKNRWLFSSNNIVNIKTAKDRLLWGFWDKIAGEKHQRNWRDFLRKYNEIQPFDIAVFQIAKTYEIHAIGVIKGTYYDDQTLIWPSELREKKVLFPWRVSFCSIIFSEEPFSQISIPIQGYIDGYGIGELSEEDFNKVISDIQKKLNQIGMDIKFS